ncbi:hypothetical protein F5880DRAFT_1619271 [Lentinula raphanica]|nr:hypothetical protein F5880DRAFT_1619271 [Lentinula raphanica]
MPFMGLHFLETPNTLQLSASCGMKARSLTISDYLLGFFGAFVWDLQASQPLRTPIDSFESSIETKFVTSAWLDFKTDIKTPRHVLVLGSLDGQIVAWDLNEGEEQLQCTRLPALRSPPQQPVLSLDTHVFGVRRTYRGQIVASFADRTVKSWTLTRSGGFNPTFSMQFEADFVPKNVRIHHENRNIYAFALKGGKWSGFDSFPYCFPADLDTSALLHHQFGMILTSVENGCHTSPWINARTVFLLALKKGFSYFAQATSVMFVTSKTLELFPSVILVKSPFSMMDAS